MKPTISTVARRAGVAVSTVSRYLNGHYVSQPVKARLSKVIVQLGYSRSWTARNLSLGRKGCVGLVVDSNQSPWFMQLLIGIEKELATRESSLMLSTLDSGGRSDRDVAMEWIRSHRIDGLIIVKFGSRERPLLARAVRSGVPTILLAPREPAPNQRVVRSDNFHAGVTIANHLADLGHKRIAFEGGAPYLDLKDRLRGLRNGLADRDIALDPKFVSFCGKFESEAGMEFAYHFFKKPPPVTALVMGNDSRALGFMRVAQQRGIRIPQDMSVAGFDDIPESGLVWPGLTTVAQPIREMSRLACQRLFDVTPSAKNETIECPMHLIVRESTGAVARKRGASLVGMKSSRTP
jgi:LacI family transcriptional regulator